MCMCGVLIVCICYVIYMYGVYDVCVMHVCSMMHVYGMNIHDIHVCVCACVLSHCV